jgi:methionyl aminopeptidase
MVVHGIPGGYELQRGDILSIDIGVVLDGWVADAAITHPIGPVTPVAQRPAWATGSATSRMRCSSVSRPTASP